MKKSILISETLHEKLKFFSLKNKITLLDAANKAIEIYIDSSKIDPTLIQKRREYLKKNMESRESLMKIFENGYRYQGESQMWSVEEGT